MTLMSWCFPSVLHASAQVGLCNQKTQISIIRAGVTELHKGPKTAVQGSKLHASSLSITRATDKNATGYTWIRRDKFIHYKTVGETQMSSWVGSSK